MPSEDDSSNSVNAKATQGDKRVADSMLRAAALVLALPISLAVSALLIFWSVNVHVVNSGTGAVYVVNSLTGERQHCNYER